MPIPRTLKTSLVLFMFVGGCAAPEENTAVSTAQTPPQPSSQPPQVSPETVPDQPTSQPADPDMLLGLEPRDVQAILGPVSLKRWEGDGQVMQFSNSQCVMDIYFYESTPGGAFQATYVSARTTGGAEADAALCLGSLMPN